MGGHGVRAADVHCDELPPRSSSVEHRVWTGRRTDVFRMDCEGPQLPADADQHRSNSPMHWRVNPAFWLTAEHFGCILDTYTKQMERTMIKQDLNVIAGIQQRLGQLPILETLVYIENNTQEFTIAELRSFYNVMSQFRALFARA